MTFALVGYKSSESGQEDVYGETGARSVSPENNTQGGMGIRTSGGGVSEKDGSMPEGGGGSGSSSESGGGSNAGISVYNNGENCVDGMKNAIILLGSTSNVSHDSEIITGKAKTFLGQNGYDESVPVYNNDFYKVIRFGEGTSAIDKKKMIYCEKDMLRKAQVVLGYTTKDDNYKYDKLEYYYVGCCGNNNVNSSTQKVSYSKMNRLWSSKDIQIQRHEETNHAWNHYLDLCDTKTNVWYSCDKVRNQCLDIRRGGLVASGKFKRCAPTDLSLYNYSQ